MAYATAFARNPETTYRQVDLAGRSTTDGAGLVALLYEELRRALGAAAAATEHRRFAIKSERVTRATAILFALEAGLDFDKGGSVSQALAGFYAGARARIVEASIGHDPGPFREVATSIGEIAEAWATVRN